MMRTIHWLIALLVMTLAAVGCQDERILPDIGNIPQPDRVTRYTLYTDTPPLLKPMTRTGTAKEDDMAGSDFWVFVFDNTSTPADPADIKLLEIAKAEPTTSVGPDFYKWVTNLKTYNHPVKVLMIANAPALVYSANGTGGVAISPASFPVDMTYADALAKLYTAKLATPLASVPYTPELTIPMARVMDFAELSSQTDLGTEATPLKLPRVVAKITVDNMTPATSLDFALVGANLHNAPAASCIAQRTAITDAAALTKYEGATAGQEVTDIAAATVLTPAVAGVKETTVYNPLYCYEANAIDTKNLFLIVQGTYKGVSTYYKMGVSLTTDGAPIATIGRNMHYRFLIKECTGSGYATYAEAVASPSSSNLIYTVDVTDLSSHDIIDNGRYYIGLSNSEYHFYAASSLANLPVATLHTGTNNGVTPFNSTITITSSNPATLSVETPTFTHPATNEVIRVAVTNDFVSGILTVQLGSLTKEIKVERKDNSLIEIKDELIVNSNYQDNSYKVASVANPKPWIKLGISPSVTLANGQDRIASNGGGIYIAYNTSLAAPDLESVVYISRSDNSGHIKAHFLLSP